MNGTVVVPNRGASLLAERAEFNLAPLISWLGENPVTTAEVARKVKAQMSFMAVCVGVGGQVLVRLRARFIYSTGE
jgi:hypothetical protein